MRCIQFLVLALLFLQDSSIVDSCKPAKNKCVGVDTVALKIALRIGSLFAIFIPGGFGGAFTTALWMGFDRLGSDPDIECYIKMYLKEYHQDRIISSLILYKQDLVKVKNDPTKVEAILRSFEDPSNMVRIHSELSDYKAAIFPLIVPWAAFHLGIYRELINQYSLDKNKVDALKKEQRERSNEYTKQMLNSYRLYRNMKRDEKKDEKIADTAFEFVNREEIRNILDVPGGQFHKLLSSCIVRNGDMVALSPSKGSWLGCQKTGTKCRTSGSCPGEFMKFEHNNAKNDYVCQGEVFWIYADSVKKTDGQILGGATVNLLSTQHDGHGYWLSSVKAGLDTKTCPGKSFSRINRACTRENYKMIITKNKPHGMFDVINGGLYDGSYIRMRNTWKLFQGTYSGGTTGEIFKKDSECRPN